MITTIFIYTVKKEGEEEKPQCKWAMQLLFKRKIHLANISLLESRQS